jgi:prevent-host-death family protein
MRTISAADANRHFSKILREVAAGEPVIVTSRGKPLIKMAPVEDEEKREAERVAKERQAQWEAHLARLAAQPVMNIPITWTRDDIYDDDF